jgi:predicted DNA-binding protein (MmcQ/YjbR family)
MGKIKFNKGHQEVLESFLLKNKEVRAGKMFGVPAYYVGKKMFASLFEEGVCVKVPEERVKVLLKKEHIKPFRPMGRTMKDWVMVNRKESADYLKDRALFEESIRYVKSIQKK